MFCTELQNEYDFDQKVKQIYLTVPVIKKVYVATTSPRLIDFIVHVA